MNKETDYAACIRVTCYIKKDRLAVFFVSINYLSL